MSVSDKRIYCYYRCFYSLRFNILIILLLRGYLSFTCKVAVTYQIKSYLSYWETPMYHFSTVWFGFGLILCVTVNSYGHFWTVSSPNSTFCLGKLDQYSCTYVRLYLTTILLQSAEGRTIFMINLHESMRPG